MQLTDDRTS